MIGLLYPGFGIDDMALIGTFVVIVLIVLIRFIGRDPNTKRTRYGVFIERERFKNEVDESPHVALPSSLHDAEDLDDTQEIPPKEAP